MFGKPIRLFRVFGFEVGIDPSWFILFLLVTWSLALGLFPLQFPGETAATYVFMGVAGSLGLFLSIVLHELSHSLVARRYGLHMHGITLFMFGGVAELPEEPRRPGEEFWMAAAGPAASLALAALGYGAHALGLTLGWAGIGNGIVGYLALVNLALAIFNLVPAFPLDGGRVLRSACWRKTGDFAKATRIATAAGQGFGILLIGFGAARVLAGNPVGGVWWMLIGFFIRTGARSASEQLTMTRLLAGVTVRTILERSAAAAPPDPALRVRDVLAERPAEAVIGADEPAEAALKRMREVRHPTLLVMDGDRLAGIVTSGDILRYLALRAELEKTGPRGTALPGRSGPGTGRPDSGTPLPA